MNVWEKWGKEKRGGRGGGNVPPPPPPSIYRDNKGTVEEGDTENYVR